MENKYSIKSFYIPKNYLSIFEVLERYCERKGESKSHIICEAVKEYLKNHSFEEDKETVFQTLLKSE